MFEEKTHLFLTELSELMCSNQLSLTTAESCTGGWLAKLCTDLPGSSKWFHSGIVSYSNSAKQKLLYVSTSTLKKFGAVSQQTAEEMAIGALKDSAADISIAITGIAGPEGGSEAKPVGTVWMAWAGRCGLLQVQHYQFNGDRETIRQQAVLAALEGIIKNARDSRLSM